MPELNRREFIGLTGVAATAFAQQGELKRLEPSGMLGSIRKVDAPAPLKGASWYTAEAEKDGIAYQFAPGLLATARFVVAEMLVDEDNLTVFSITLQEGEKGRTFRFSFGALPQCSLRMRMDLSMVDQNRWMADREGAFLKPMAGGDRVDLSRVDRMTFTIQRKAPGRVRWCMTDPYAMPTVVDRLRYPVLPNGPLLDQFGQSAQRRWSGKTRSEEQLKARILEQYANAPKQAWPEEFSRWGGWKAVKFGEGSGFFRTHNDGKRWWLVDPDGYPFWSAGLDCVRVDTNARYDGIEAALSWLPDRKEYPDAYPRDQESPGKVVNYLAANMIRSFGRDGWRDKWSQTALAEMKRLRFNTVGNWSEWNYPSKAAFPYVRPLNFRAQRSGMIYRDFPDVYHAGFAQDAADLASQLTTTAGDPAFIGYFLMNEPTWGFSSEVPAAGMLYSTETCATRQEFARYLKSKYESDAALAAVWNVAASFDKVASGKWKGALPGEALPDLREFSSRMVERYFQTLSAACRKVDSKHLNLGMRWAGLPPEWAVKGMKFFDVFSLNCYQDKLPLERAKTIHDMLKMPVMVGEWHFGALDVGLPASGIGHLKNQQERAKAYRVYLEDAAADPYCVGAHWFTMYDESAIGRYDGENYNIGFLDVCNRPYDEIGRAAVASHERMYEVAAGKVEAFTVKLDYLPKLFI
jgi:hypothetical protein